MSDAVKGLRVCLAPAAFKRFEDSMIVRRFGTLTSGRVLRQLPGHEEGLFVRVKWDGLTTPENWHLADLAPASPPPAPEKGDET